jgi:hypothetical protein
MRVLDAAKEGASDEYRSCKDISRMSCRCSVSTARVKGHVLQDLQKKNSDDVNVESFLKVGAVICFESLVKRYCSTRFHFTGSHSFVIRPSGSQNMFQFKLT